MFASRPPLSPTFELVNIFLEHGLGLLGRVSDSGGRPSQSVIVTCFQDEVTFLWSTVMIRFRKSVISNFEKFVCIRSYIDGFVLAGHVEASQEVCVQLDKFHRRPERPQAWHSVCEILEDVPEFVRNDTRENGTAPFADPQLFLEHLDIVEDGTVCTRCMRHDIGSRGRISLPA